MDKSIPARLTKFVPAGHTNHLIGIKSIIIHANLAVFAFGRRPAGSDLAIRLGHLVVSPTAAGATGLDATFFLYFFWVVKEGLEESFFGPFVFTHEDGGS
jgi:hypothetical protein